MKTGSPVLISRADPFPKSLWPRVATVALVVYVIYACAQMEISWERVQTGLANAAHFFARLFPPNFARHELLVRGLLESLQIAVLASTLGILLALPIGLAGARNLMPPWVSWPARALIVVARSLHPVIVAILSVGFIGKLFTEAIEEISSKQVEAVRATGAPFPSVLAFGVMPQVFSRFIGFATYQLDSNLRNSTMVGIVGAGGIGGTLFAAFQRFDYDFVCAILIAIISLIMLGEVLAAGVRAIFIDNATLPELFRRRGLPRRDRLVEDE